MAHDVFISYASVDKVAADAVCRALEAQSLGCWLAPRDVPAGAPYAEAIVEAIHSTAALVLILSRAANDSDHVAREVDRAVAAGIAVFPVRIEEIEPSRGLEYYLAGRQWFDALSMPLAPHLESLCAALSDTVQEAGRPASLQTARDRPKPVAKTESRRAPRKERRVVTTLSCGLVNLTELSQSADPEDVDAVLRDYYEAARRVIESYGGTLEKSDGDAVVGVFGVPVLHEDDAERAVRAGLRLVDALAALRGRTDEPLRVSVGVDTGEALVRFDVDPGRGEGFLAGDAANVAARLQAAAPPGGVAVGATTRDLTQKAIDYEEIEPIDGKSKGAPIPAFHARAPVARVGAPSRGERLTPLVDREAELAYLTSLFEKAVASSSPALALVVGEPGIGKSRLVDEFFAYVEAHPKLVTWRQGCCLAYGEGVTFWALGEIVKAQAGILETDDAATVQAKLGTIVPEGPDREWLRNRLRALLGLEAPPAGREENFTAWLRFLEGLAAAGPAVLVFEDLHWAEEALLSFLEFFAANVADVPLLVVATARPPLFEQHPAFAASIARVHRINLERLSDEETERLVSGLLETGRAPSEIVGTIVRRCEGNPFYAEESARLIGEKVLAEVSRVFEAAGAGVSDGQVDAEAPLPGSVQAVIAARLDTLPPERKALLTDASVVGTVFWSGALEALGQRETADVDEDLRCLAAKQLVRRVRISSMEGESEFAFGHALARDVAYRQLPRMVRVRKHAAVAAWIEGKVGDRASDFAEVLAHHYATALDLARAAREEGSAESLTEPAVRYLSLAGDRAVNLDLAAAERRYARALEIAGAASPERPHLLAKRAKALAWSARFKDAVQALEEAVPGLRAAGDVRTAAVAMMKLAEVRMTLGDPDVWELGQEAVALLDGDGPSAQLVEVLCMNGFGLSILKTDNLAAVAMLDQAIAIGEQLGLPESVMALNARGCSRCELGDLGGLDDLRHAFVVAEEQGLGAELAVLHYNYAGVLYVISGPQACAEAIASGLEFVLRRGIAQYELSLRAAHVTMQTTLGEWDVALAQAAALVPVLEQAGDVFSLLMVRPAEALVFLRRGEERRAARFLEWLEENGRKTEIAGVGAGSLTAAAAVRWRLGEADAALRLLAESAAMHRLAGTACHDEIVLEAIRTALAAGNRELAGSFVEGVRAKVPLEEIVLASAEALLNEHRREYETAAAGFADAALGWHNFGVPYEEAQALLGQGRCLVTLARATEAGAPLAAAREIFARLGAKPALAETELLMEQTGELRVDEGGGSQH